MRAKFARALRVVSERLHAKVVSGVTPGAARSSPSLLSASMEPLESRQLLSTYYVSPSGSDSASGTSSGSAWKSINRVNSQSLHSGDKVLFKGGSSFSGSVYLPSGKSGVTFGIYGSGKATINSGSKPGFDISKASSINISNFNIRGNGMSSNSAAGIYVHTDGGKSISGFTIKSVDVSGYGMEGIKFQAATGSAINNVNVSYSSTHDNLWGGLKASTGNISGMHDYVIDHVTAYNNTGTSRVSGVTGNGIFLEGVSNGKINRCIAYSNGKSGAAPVGIWCARGNNYTIQYCESYNNNTRTSTDGGGFDFDWDVSNSTMQYNYSHGNAGPGYILAAGTHTLRSCTVRYNVSENDGRKNGRAGMQIWGDVRDSSILNNAVYITSTGNSNTAGMYIHDLGADGRTPQNLNVRNNIFYTTGGVKILNVTSGVVSKGTVHFNGNCYHSGGSSFKIHWGNNDYSSLSSWRDAKGQEKMNGSATGYQGDPKLNSAGHGGTISNIDSLTSLSAYKLQSSSPLINKGVTPPGTLSSSVTDFFGDTLPKGGKYDIGVDEVA